jgi:hypothetical protein
VIGSGALAFKDLVLERENRCRLEIDKVRFTRRESAGKAASRVRKVLVSPRPIKCS